MLSYKVLQIERPRFFLCPCCSQPGRCYDDAPWQGSDGAGGFAYFVKFGFVCDRCQHYWWHREPTVPPVVVKEEIND